MLFRSVPTMAEEVAGFDYPGSWLGFFGPANMSPAILERWHGIVVRGLNAPDVKAKLEISGMTVVTNTPKEFAEVLRRGIETFGRAVKIAGIQPE